MLMRAQVMLEFLLLLMLIQYIFYLSEPAKIKKLRSSIEFANDIAQVYVYTRNASFIAKKCLENRFYCEVGGIAINSCEAPFIYCTSRVLFPGAEEVRICAGECY